MSLAAPVEENAGAAALVHHAPLANGRSLWVAGCRLHGLKELRSQALAMSGGGRWGRWGLAFHQLDAGFWREQQALVRWAPSQKDDAALDASLGIEVRRQASEESGWADHTWWPQADLAWRAGALRLGAGSAVTGPLTHAALEGHVNLACTLPKGFALSWQGSRAAGRRDERAALLWRHAKGGAALGWKEGRGWEVAAQARWRSFQLSASWRSHPVLPPSQAWGLAWRDHP